MSELEKRRKAIEAELSEIEDEISDLRNRRNDLEDELAELEKQEKKAKSIIDLTPEADARIVAEANAKAEGEGIASVLRQRFWLKKRYGVPSVGRISDYWQVNP